MTSYSETVLRYRILRHDELPESHKECYRKNGINPDENWQLIWSFYTLEAAEKCLENCNEEKASYQTYKLVDNGEASVIEREIY